MFQMALNLVGEAWEFYKDLMLPHEDYLKKGPELREQILWGRSKFPIPLPGLFAPLPLITFPHFHFSDLTHFRSRFQSHTSISDHTSRSTYVSTISNHLPYSFWASEMVESRSKSILDDRFKGLFYSEICLSFFGLSLFWGLKSQNVCQNVQIKISG